MQRRILITAGPTHEPIDAVRYLANRSSGQLGLALAQAARDAGWHVVLLLGPVGQPSLAGVEVYRFETARELQDLLKIHFPACDLLVMAAAVADYRPKTVGTGKLQRKTDGMSLELEATPDLVADCARSKRTGQCVVAFALEELGKLDVKAREKMINKAVDAVVANPLDTMSARTIEATVLFADGRSLSPGKMQKDGFARWLMELLTDAWPGV